MKRTIERTVLTGLLAVMAASTAHMAYADYCDIEDCSSVPTDMTIDVPEPTVLALVSLGLAGIGFSRRKKK